MIIVSPKQFSERIGVSVITLQHWDNAGKLVAHRSSYGLRKYKKGLSDDKDP